jgi:hypothetical protein
VRTVGELAGLARRQADTYREGADRPLAGYLGAIGAYLALVAGGTGAVRLSGRRLPERPATSDLVLLAVASHKGARLLAKDPVASPLRAPFTVFRGSSGEAELAEEPRAGARHSVGELVSCPFCLGQWMATLLCFGLVLAPRPTRFLAGVLAVRAGSDALQFGYDALQRSAGD